MDIKTIQTKSGELQFYQDWDRTEGSIIMINAKTIERYKELRKSGVNVDLSEFDCFFAFTDEQFKKGLKSIRPLKEGEKLIQICNGGFITKDGNERLDEFYKSIHEQIKDECDPQEVYFYEYNNHECMFSWDGDYDALDIIKHYWNEDIANSIHRL